MNKLESDKDVISGQQVFVAYPACPDDEISLVDIWKILYKGKKIIIGSFVAGVLVAVVAAMLLPKIYRAQTVLLPPQLSDVVALSVSGIYKAEPQAIYRNFLVNLQSHGLRYQYFKNHIFQYVQDKIQVDKVDDYELFIQRFDKLLKISFNTKTNRSDFTIVTLDGEKQDNLANLLGNYISFINKQTVNKMANDVQAILNLRIKVIREQISSLRLIAYRERLDRIARLKEAYNIAKVLQIEKPTGSAFVTDEKRKTSDKGKTGIIFGNNEVPLYFRGYLALEGELRQLRNRKSDDSFIVGLRELQSKLSFLECKKIDTKNVNAVLVDQQARTDNKPIKPKGKLIILLGGILGLIGGCLGAFVENMMRSAKVVS